MKFVEFEKMHISIPMKEGETRELDTVSEDFLASYTLNVNEYDD